MRHETQFDGLGTRIRVLVRTEGEINPRAIADAFATVREMVDMGERRWSRFRPDSEVSTLNRAAGKWVDISPETASVLRCALAAHRATSGLVHPALGRHLAAAGYDRPWPELTDAANAHAANTHATHADRANIDAANVSASDPEDAPLPSPADPLVEISPDGSRARVAVGFAVDLGGIAKGWIVARAAERLWAMGFSHFIVDAGGDMVCAGHAETGPWRIGVMDPLDPSRDIAVLEVSSMAIATSGTYRRRWQRHGQTAHHIVDPRTGRPAVTDVASCTVAGADLVTLEWLAKWALLLGAQAGEEMLRRQPLAGWVMVTEAGEVRHAWNS